MERFWSETSLCDAIAGRRSIRRYRTDEVPAIVLQRLLEAAVKAPSAHNRQPWRFVVLQDGSVKLALADAMGRRLRQDRTSDGDDPYADAARAHAEFLMAVQSTAMAAQNLMLAAHSEGLGSCWMCAPLFCPEVVRTTLDLPQQWQPQALVTMGFPAGAGNRRPRKPLNDVVRQYDTERV